MFGVVRCSCLYPEGIASHSPGLPHIAATLGNRYDDLFYPNGVASSAIRQSIPNISLVILDLVPFEKLTKLRFEILHLVMLFLFLDVLDDMIQL